MRDRTGGEQGRPAPLVEPAAALSDEQRARAGRQLILPGFGEIAQRRLAAARVLVIGAGGLGSACVPYLVGSGVGTIGIVDDDRVELSNLHRQVAHRTADIGRRKTSSLAEAARAIDPGATVVEHDLRLDSGNALRLFGDYDLVIDGSDNFPTRYLVDDAASLSGIPLVWGAILSHHGQLGVAWHAHGPGYRDLFPTPPPAGEALSCSTAGVLPGLCGTVGSLLATEALKLITGIGEPLIGRVLVYDALEARTREIGYERDPLAPPVTGLIDYERFCAGPGSPPAMTAAELTRRLEGAGGIPLVDVRMADERAWLRIDPSESLPLEVIEADPRVAERLPREGVVAVYCAEGSRSIRAARILREHGVDARYLSGGIQAFERSSPQLLIGDAVGAVPAKAAPAKAVPAKAGGR